MLGENNINHNLTASLLRSVIIINNNNNNQRVIESFYHFGMCERKISATQCNIMQSIWRLNVCFAIWLIIKEEQKFIYIYQYIN